MNFESRTTTRIGLELVLASFIVLFQELALIRWMGGQVRVLAYFPNLILISTFLGLGLGCLLAGRRSVLWLWPASLLVLTGATALMSGVVFTQRSGSEHLWLLYYNLPKDAPVVPDIKLPILISFVLAAISFVPLGQIVAERIQQFRVRSSALWGYSFDILGSLFGVVLFAIMGLTGTFPVHWFAVVVILGSWFFLGRPKLGVVYAVLAIAILLLVAQVERASAYSPYYSLLQRPTEGTNIEVLANGTLHQRAMDLERGPQPRAEYEEVVLEGYHVPYRMLDRPPRKALVLGAGTGNDVATLLDEGAERIDVVEIDPVILEWGERHHPNGPYASDRVRLFNTDARSFLENTAETYDLIVLGTLDSMTRLSALSNVRLDNFVYTQESIDAIKRRLAPDGGLVMYFMVSKRYIGERFAAMLTQSFEEFPLIYRRNHNLFNTIFMSGPAFATATRRAAGDNKQQTARFIQEALPGIQVPNDDWPFLYLQERGVSGFYAIIMASIAALAIAGILAVSPEFRSGLLRAKHIDGEMFLFGLAFLLLETRSVTEMNLIWGATWITSAVVFGSILVMVLLATIGMQLRPLSYRLCGIGLVASLIAAYLFPVGFLLGGGMTAQLVLSVLLVGTPIFFASACFARLFRERKAVDRAFGWNLLGAVAGGLVEFVSMWSGLKALLLVALAAYLLAFYIRK